MFYKRPSLRRGGMPTGIEQLTPRKNFQFGTPGFQFLEPGLQREVRSNYLNRPDRFRFTVGPGVKNPFLRGGLYTAPFIPTGIMAYANRPRTTEALKVMKSEPSSTFDETGLFEYEEFSKKMDKANKKGEEISFLDAFLMDPESGTYPKFAGRTKDRDIKKEIEKAEEKKFLPNAGPKQVNFDDIANDVVTNKDTSKDTSKDTPKELTFDDIYQTEYNRLEKLIGGREDEKGMLAIALSDAIGTEGTIADKAATLNKSLLKIVGDRKSNKKDIAKLAYSATKEIEKAKIVAGKVSDSQKNFNRAEKLIGIINNKNSSETDIAAAKKELKNLEQAVNIFGKRTEGSLTGVSSGGQLINELSKLAKKINKQEKGSNKYNELLSEYMASRNFLLGFNNPGLNNGVATTDAIIGFETKKDGGRIGYAMGTSNPTSKDMSDVPAEPVEQNLSFEQLRSRLPKEITNDIVRLISDSSQALQDFAYIRTQGDVNKFNMKYGVNLVLPAQA